MIAHSFLHGGFPFVGMSKAVIAYIITSSVDEALPYLTIEDVPDFTVREIMQEAADGAIFQRPKINCFWHIFASKFGHFQAMLIIDMTLLIFICHLIFLDKIPSSLSQLLSQKGRNINVLYKNYPFQF